MVSVDVLAIAAMVGLLLVVLFYGWWRAPEAEPPPENTEPAPAPVVEVVA